MEATTAKQRVELEREELNTKIEKLASYLEQGNRDQLEMVAHDLLYVQLHTMRSYLAILDMRLALWVE